MNRNKRFTTDYHHYKGSFSNLLFKFGFNDYYDDYILNDICRWPLFSSSIFGLSLSSFTIFFFDFHVTKMPNKAVFTLYPFMYLQQKCLIMSPNGLFVQILILMNPSGILAHDYSLSSLFWSAIVQAISKTNLLLFITAINASLS